jgi:hypothetical protein
LSRNSFYIVCFSLISNLLITTVLHAQFRVRGTVYDSSKTFVLQAVSVLSTSGKGTFTDSNGHYEIEVNEKDSIWFSYLGKPTVKYAVLKMNDPLNFDVSIQLNVTVLKGVTVRPRSYRMDSIQNRIDYAKIFNYEKPKIAPTVYGVGVGFDLDQIIQMFQFRKNKNTASFQRRLLQQEQDKFIDHRFSKQLVKQLTDLSGAKLDSFMIIYRPSYLFCQTASEYELGDYIKTCYALFIQRNTSSGLRKENK